MTFTDPRMLDLTGFDRPPDAQPRAEDGELHMLRLALDLQLDAMLLTLGAAAQADGRSQEDAGAAPWQRWLAEDLELARTLATALVDSGGAPLPGLGGRFAPGRLDTSLANLTVRFENMERLLAGVLDRQTLGLTWRAAAGEALQRCRARLGELNHHRGEVVDDGGVLTTPSLPGEWLG